MLMMDGVVWKCYCRIVSIEFLISKFWDYCDIVFWEGVIKLVNVLKSVMVVKDLVEI